MTYDERKLKIRKYILRKLAKYDVKKFHMENKELMDELAKK